MAPWLTSWKQLSFPKQWGSGHSTLWSNAQLLGLAFQDLSHVVPSVSRLHCWPPSPFSCPGFQPEPTLPYSSHTCATLLLRLPLPWSPFLFHSVKALLQLHYLLSEIHPNHLPWFTNNCSLFLFSNIMILNWYFQFSSCHGFLLQSLSSINVTSF